MKKISAKNIVAAAGIILFTAVGTLTFLDRLRVSRFTAALEFKGRQMCQHVASNQPFKREATSVLKDFAELFAIEFRDIHSRYRARLQQVNLVLPAIRSKDSTKAMAIEPRPFENIIDRNLCSGIAGLDGDCQFITSLEELRFAVPDYRSSFPLPLWHADGTPNRVVGCALDGEVGRTFSLFGLFRPVKTRVSVALTAGDVSAQDVANEQLGHRGLSILIASHMTTSGDPYLRFKFAGGTWQGYDPLEGFAVGEPAGSPNFYETEMPPTCTPSAVDNANRCIAAPQRISALYKSSRWVGPRAEVDEVGEPGRVPTDYEYMRIACMNPAILVRNAFLTTFVELASRRNTLRYGTEILHVSTQHRDVGSRIEDVGKLSSIPNPPVVLVPRGSDLMNVESNPDQRETYQLPYVFFNAGNLNDTPGPFMPGSGIIYPFNDRRSSEAQLKYRSLIAGQLRYCFHLYQCEALDETDKRVCPNQLLRPYSVNRLDREGRKNERGLQGVGSGIRELETWDQPCPWGSKVEDCSVNKRGEEHQKAFRLSAGDLVAVLGSTQLCPYPHHGAFMGMPCRAPEYDYVQHVSNDLRPDIRAALHYLNGSLPAVEAPGLFPIGEGTSGYMSYVWPNNGVGDYSPFEKISGLPFDARFYRQVTTEVSNILIVTHRLPSEAEATMVAEMLSGSDAWKKRVVHVVFIPVRRVQVEHVERFKRAFLVDRPGMKNQLYVLSPYTENDKLRENAGWMSPVDIKEEAEDFLLYWSELVRPHRYLAEQQSIEHRAQHVFNKLVSG